MKNLIFILFCTSIVFSSCQKCKECEPAQGIETIIGYEDVFIGNIPGTIIMDANGNLTTTPNTPVYESQPVYSYPIKINVEVCQDNFQSKEEYKTYISTLETAGYKCRADFGN